MQSRLVVQALVVIAALCVIGTTAVNAAPARRVRDVMTPATVSGVEAGVFIAPRDLPAGRKARVSPRRIPSTNILCMCIQNQSCQFGDCTYTPWGQCDQYKNVTSGCDCYSIPAC